MGWGGVGWGGVGWGPICGPPFELLRDWSCWNPLAACHLVAKRIIDTHGHPLISVNVHVSSMDIHEYPNGYPMDLSKNISLLGKNAQTWGFR